MKKTIKKFNPAFTIDITNCVDAVGVLAKFAAVKIKNGICPTTEEWICLMTVEMCITFDVLLGNNDAIVITKDRDVIPAIICTSSKTTVVEAKPKKQNVFKRFWNWITRKK